jgi:hypothetical protein
MTRSTGRFGVSIVGALLAGPAFTAASVISIDTDAVGVLTDIGGDGTAEGADGGFVGGFVSPSINQILSGPSETATTRTQFEFPLTDLAGFVSGDIDSAVIVLTGRGGTTTSTAMLSVDSFYFVSAADQDGLITLGDFDASYAASPAAVVASDAIAVGQTAPIRIDVTAAIRDAVDAGWTHLALQGRVDESNPITLFRRGIETRTSFVNGVNPADTVPLLVVNDPAVIPEPASAAGLFALGGLLLRRTR